MKTLAIKDADYISNYKIKLIFNDTKIKVVDFSREKGKQNKIPNILAVINQ